MVLVLLALATRSMPQDLVASGVAEGLDIASLAVGAAMKPVIDANPQLRLLDLYGLYAVSNGQCVLLNCRNACRRKSSALLAADMLSLSLCGVVSSSDMHLVF